MRTLILACLMVPLLAGCMNDELDIGPKPDYDPQISPDDFVEGIDHPYLAYTPGTRLVYHVYEEGEHIEVIEIEVLAETRLVNGVAATVVRDIVYLEGDDGEFDVLDEFTDDWFAQDKDGNVWYLGEDSTGYVDGVGTKAGSFEWGADGALPGILMPANPTPGEPYFMEFYWNDDDHDFSALDEGQVMELGRSVTVPAGTFTDTVVTAEWTRLEPDTREEAIFARGIGVVWKGEIGEDEEEILVSYTIG